MFYLFIENTEYIQQRAKLNTTDTVHMLIANKSTGLTGYITTIKSDKGRSCFLKYTTHRQLTLNSEHI